MLKFIPKIFRSKAKYAQSGMSFAVEIHEKTKGKVFDDAVNGVVKSELRKILVQEMEELCYSDEVVSQTKFAIARTKKGESLASTRKLFPQALFEQRDYRFDGYSFGLVFNMDLFLDRLIEGEL